MMRNGALGFVRQQNVSHILRPSIIHARFVRLPPRSASVTGTIYESKEGGSPQITLFTKEGCTLCDKVKEILSDFRESHPHTLKQIDITDEEHQEWFDRYKYDIPVLHLDGKYWIKHRITSDEVIQGFDAAREGRFESPRGEPNAAAMERS